MKFNISGININVEYDPKENGKENKIFFLHGFTGSTKDWENILPQINKNFQSISIDFIGHGKSDAPSSLSDYTSESITKQLIEIIKYFAKEKIVVAGYSMGGRAALSFAVEYLDMVKGLILESASAGLEKEGFRKERIKKDEELANFIENNPLDKFVEQWMDLEMFNTQKRFSNQKLESIKKDKLNCSKIGLANSLRGFGTGTMLIPAVKLKSLKAKVLLITGELDTKFTNINSKLTKYFHSANHKIIKSAGHNTHIEEPTLFIETVNKFLDKF